MNCHESSLQCDSSSWTSMRQPPAEPTVRKVLNLPQPVQGSEMTGKRHQQTRKDPQGSRTTASSLKGRLRWLLSSLSERKALSLKVERVSVSRTRTGIWIHKITQGSASHSHGNLRNKWVHAVSNEVLCWNNMKLWVSGKIRFMSKKNFIFC